MSAKHLSNRDLWQKDARITGDKGEDDFISALSGNLPDYYYIQAKPRDLTKIYNGQHGIIPDSKIVNTKTGKCLFVEKKKAAGFGILWKYVQKDSTVFTSHILLRLFHHLTQP